MKKKVLSLVLALILCLTLAAPALAADSDFVIKNGVLTKYNGSGGDVVIPTGVTSIGYAAFNWCTSLTSVTIPNSVTSIGDQSFSSCKNLTSVTIPSSVTSIGRSAFWHCTALHSVTIPSSVTSIGSGAFERCYLLTSVTISSGLTSIKYDTFAFCNSLTSVTIPDSVTSIGAQAFYGCSALTSVTIPDSVTSIEQGAFSNCSALTSVTIPNSVTNIEWQMFDDCSGLTSVTIPSSVTSIGWQAFYDCENLTDIYYSGTEAQWKKITIETGNGNLLNATIHYNSTGPGSDGSEDISTITINGKSIQSLFSKSSFEYDNDLALFAANLSMAAEDETGDRILNYYRELGWQDADREIYRYGGDWAYSIACAKLSKDENLLVITARGSMTKSEFLDDGLSRDQRDFFGYTTNALIYGFERYIMADLTSFLTDHKYLKEKDLKILITGHSLGGAAANLNAARFTMFEDSGAWWSDLTEQSDIYCYTFGAINSLSDNSTVKKGFENIHNVYNLQDSFGPYRWGNKLPSGLGRGYGKFGHMDAYSHNFEGRGDDQYVFFVNITNHLIEKYIDSLTERYVSCKVNSAFTLYGGGGWCPVDLKIYLETTDGPVLVGSITDNQIDEVEHPMVGLRVDGDKKYFYFPDDGSYIIELEGTDNGTMTFFVQDMNAETGEPVPGTGKVFQNVSLTPGKQFSSEVSVVQETAANAGKDVALYVLGEDNKPAKEVLPDGKGTEVPYEPKPAQLPFDDVAAGQWYYDAVYWAVQKGITNGTGSNKFSPDKTCSTAEILTFLWRACDKPQADTAGGFTDVAAGIWYADAAAWAKSKGMVSGPTLSPETPCTRASAVMFIWQAMGKPLASSPASFKDVPANSDYADAVAWAVEKGVTNGTGKDTFSPDTTCTRGHIVTFLNRAFA